MAVQLRVAFRSYQVIAYSERSGWGRAGPGDEHGAPPTGRGGAQRCANEQEQRGAGLRKFHPKDPVPGRAAPVPQVTGPAVAKSKTSHSKKIFNSNSSKVPQRLSGSLFLRLIMIIAR